MEQARKICLEMIQQRGYSEIIDTEDTIMSTKPDGGRVQVFFLTGQFGAPALKEYMSIMNKADVSHCIVVVGESITNPARALVADLRTIIFELFEVKELQFNITKHCLQAQSYTCLSEEETSDFIKNYGRKIPRTKIVDPIARFFYFRAGNIIKTVRRDGYVTYRIIV